MSEIFTDVDKFLQCVSPPAFAKFNTTKSKLSLDTLHAFVRGTHTTIFNHKHFAQHRIPSQNKLLRICICVHVQVMPVHADRRILLTPFILPSKSKTAPQDAHKLVLEVAEWLTASLSVFKRGARHELTT